MRRSDGVLGGSRLMSEEDAKQSQHQGQQQTPNRLNRYRWNSVGMTHLLADCAANCTRYLRFVNPFTPFSIRDMVMEGIG